MSSSAQSSRVTSHKWVKRIKKKNREVSIPQLYRDICAGYDYFIKKRMKTESLGVIVRHVSELKLKKKGNK